MRPPAHPADRLVRKAGVVGLQVIGIAAVESQGSLCSVDFQAEIVFGARGQLRRPQDTQRARAHPCKQHHRVLGVDLHLPGRIFHGGAFGVSSVRGRGDRPVIAQQMVHQVDHVRAEVGNHPAAGLGRKLPLQRCIGVDAAGVQQPGAELQHVAQEPLVHKLLRPHDGGKESGLHRHLGRGLIVRKRRADLLGLVHGGHQRLVAIDVLVVLDGRQQGVLVQMVGRANVDDVDPRVFGDLAEIGHRRFGPEHAAGPLGRLGSTGGHVGDLRHQRRRVIEQRQIPIPVGVDLADIAEADNADTVGFHRSAPFWCLPAIC